MKIIFTLVIVLVTFLSFAQVSLAPFFLDGKWGFVNSSGEIVIEPQYRKAYSFSEEGLAVVLSIEGEWKYINKNNEPLNVEIQGVGADRKGFNDGLAVIIFGRKKGVINTKGEIVFTPEYDFIHPFSEGFSVAEKGKEFYILSKDGSAKKVEVDLLTMNRFSNGLAPIRGKNKKFGFMNTKGEVVIKPQFISVGHFTAQLAWARDDSKKAGLINQKGEWVVEAKYEYAKFMDAETGLMRVRDESGWKFVDVNGVEIKAEGAVAYGDFHNGLAWARNSMREVGFINVKGEWVIEPSFQSARHFSDGYCAVKVIDEWGFINKKGEWVIKPSLVKVRDFKLIN